jgi:dihydrofolate synthase / folylpolyglutamate synthase
VNYPDSVQFLYALGNEIKTAKFGLERMHVLIRALGHPERAFRKIHVAGTNGKGSTCAMIEAGLRATGIRTGLYTSPHLVEPAERVRIDGMPVTHAQFTQAFEHVHSVAEKLIEDGSIDFHPTYFETVTAMAFELFRDLQVDTAVIEVGLGGRLDATNVIEPALTVITPVDFDHEQFLGNTIESIAGEKAGILKRGVPAIFARQSAAAERVIESTAESLGIEYARTSDCALADVEFDARSSRFTMDGVRIHCPLAGEHQIENAMTAALALRKLGVAPNGIADTVWPGRLEQVATNPEIILDGAHNPAGAKALAAYIERFYAGREIWLIYGTMRDKAVDEVAATLFPLASEIIATAPHFARALRPGALQSMWPGENLRVAEGVQEALEAARGSANKDAVIFITGSLFLVGEARALLVQ